MKIKEILKLWLNQCIKQMYAARPGEDIRASLIQRLEKYSEDSQEEYSLYVRPKYASQMPVQRGLSAAQKRTAIVMQGPLVREHDFTLETVKCYKKLFPDAVVILSTWDTEDIGTLRQLQEQENCQVVTLAQPEHSGILNLNYQIVSTMAGIRRACELQREYVFKTRCDQRFLKAGLLDYMVSLCEAFPLEDGICGQTQRIICDGGVRQSVQSVLAGRLLFVWSNR